MKVVVNSIETEKITDCIFVFCIDDGMSEQLRDVYGKLNIEKAENLVKSNRSFASTGFPVIGWKAYLTRFIYMLPGTMQNTEFARTITKNEFRHALGLGDLYKDLSMDLCGVDGATYSDIEPYYLGDHYFDMVMCNNGPVRNNDIKMVLLAFQTNSF